MMTSFDCAALTVVSLMLVVQLVATASVELLPDKNDQTVARSTEVSPSEIGGNPRGDGQPSPPASPIACSPDSPSCNDAAVVTDTVGSNDNDVAVTSSMQNDNLSPPLLRAQQINDLPIQEPVPLGQGQTSDCSSTNDGLFNDVTCQDTAGNTDQETGKESTTTPPDDSATLTRSSVDAFTSLEPLNKPSAPAQQGELDSMGGIMTSSTVDNEYRYVDEEHEYFGIGGNGGMSDVRGPAEVDSEDDDMADYYDVVDYGRNNNNYNSNLTSVELAAGSSDLPADRTQMIVDERNADDNHVLSDESTSAGNFDAGKPPYRDFDDSNNDQVAVNRAPVESNSGTNDDDLWSAGVVVDGAGRTSVQQQQQQQQAVASWFDTHGEFSAFVVYTWLAVASASLVIVIIMIRYRHEVSMAVQYVKNGYIHTKQRANDVVEEANDLLSNAQV